MDRRDWSTMLFSSWRSAGPSGGGLAVSGEVAYGANMSARQLAKRLRCSDVTALKRRAAVLPDYRLTFDKLSSSDPTIGYANIVPDPGDTVITFQPGTNRPGHLAVH